MFVNVNGLNIWCDSEGNGIPLILPSYSGVLYLQRALPATLRKFFRMIFIEPRGGGRSDAGDEISLSLMAEDIEEVRKVFGLHKPYFFGWSANAYIALEYASKFSENTAGLVLISMPPKYNEELLEVQKKYWDEFADEKRKNIFDENQKELKSSQLNIIEVNEKIIAEYVANGSKYFFNPKFDSLALWRGQIFNYKNLQKFYGELLMDFDVIEKLKNIDVPIISFNGKYDFIVPYQYAVSEIEGYSNVNVNIFNKSGHYPFMEEENKFIKSLMHWVNEN